MAHDHFIYNLFNDSINHFGFAELNGRNNEYLIWEGDLRMYLQRIRITLSSFQAKN